MPESGLILSRLMNVLSIAATYIVRYALLICKFKFREARSWIKGIRHAIEFINSTEYKKLPIIPSIM